MKRDYPGKPGPKPSGGVKRRILFPFALNADEYEFLTRYARHMKVAGKITGYLRQVAFPRTWRATLIALRNTQGANIKP